MIHPRRMIGRLARAMIRVAEPAPGRTDGTTPVSRSFGFDRGTPIDRYYIEAFLREQAGSIRGRVMEVGDRTYTRRFGGAAVEHSAVLLARGAVAPAQGAGAESAVVADLTDPSTLPEGGYDCFICTQTFNVVYGMREAVRGAHRLLDPGGVLLTTVAGISQISRYDMDRWGDYWRFTTASLERVLREAFGDRVTVRSYGNVLAATSFLRGLAVEDLPDRKALGVLDPDYQLVIAASAHKAG